MAAITYVDDELCTCYPPKWWAKRMCVNAWGPCYYTVRLANLTPRSVAEEYVRRNKAVGNSLEESCRGYSGGSNYGGRLRYQVGGHMFTVAGVPAGEQPRLLRSYEMYVRVDDAEQVFDLRKLWGSTYSEDVPRQASLF